MNLLQDIVVIDFSQFLSGPSAALRLADMGAEVIKIEKPGTGDICRQLYVSDVMIEGESTIFHAINRNKKSYAADLKDADDLEKIKLLLAKADVMMHNFRPGVMERLGLDYETVKKINPSIAYAEISGYGNEGPWKDLPGQDLLLQAATGLTWLSNNSNENPTPMGVAVVDIMAGAHITQGILATLYKRSLTGRGAFVQVSMFESALDFQFEVLTCYYNDGNQLPVRSAINSGHAYVAAPYGIYKTKDDYIALAMTDIVRLGSLLHSEALKKFTDAGDWFDKRTDGNRQTLTLGMLMTQLIDPYRYGLFTLLYDSESPEGEMLIDYADKEWKRDSHIGETPVQILNELLQHGEKSQKALMSVKKNIKREKDEFNRLLNDIECYRLLAYHFVEKVRTALLVLRFKYSNDINDLQSAEKYLKWSVTHYADLVVKTRNTYLYANSMQTQQRKIPMRGVDGSFKHWYEMLPVFENEHDVFRRKIDSLKNNSGGSVKQVIPLRNVHVDISGERYPMEEGVKVFSDTNFIVKKYAAELKGLNGLRLSLKKQLQQGTELSFSCDKPVKLLVGYFRTQRAAFTTDTIFAKAPELETNASADDHGQAETRISNAIALEGLPPVNIHVYDFKEGKNILKLPKGVCLVLGFVDGQQVIPVYDAMQMGDDKNKNLDWLFE